MAKKSVAPARTARGSELAELERVLHWKGDALASLECKLEHLEDRRHQLELELGVARMTAKTLRWVLLAGAAALGAWGLARRR